MGQLAVVIGVMGYLRGHVLELILGEIKQLEVPILVAFAAPDDKDMGKRANKTHLSISIQKCKRNG